MSDLNQYELSRIFGSKIKPVKQARFGNFALLETTGETLKAQDDLQRQPETSQKFGYEQDRVVVEAFEDARRGGSTDALLWDRKLLNRFLRCCRDRGLDAPPSLLNRRLINVRKNKSRYAQRGIVISPTTREEPKHSIVPEYAPVVEFALVRLRYRYGASIDDILLDLELCTEYESLTRQIVPELSAEEVRRAALYIRKARFIKKREEQAIRSLPLSVIQDELTSPISLDKIDLQQIPETPGLVEIDENARYLYIAEVNNLRPLAQELATGKPFQIVKSLFWEPDPSKITLRFASGRKFGGVSVKDWEHRLIHDFDPLFNWPMCKNHDTSV